MEAMTKKFKDALYQLQSKQEKYAKRHANIGYELEGKTASIFFSKQLKDRTCKIKQYLN